MKKLISAAVFLSASVAIAFATDDDSLTKENATGWIVKNGSSWISSSGLTVTTGSDGSLTLKLDDSSKSWVSEVTSSSKYGTYTFAVTFDFTKLSTPSSDTELITTSTTTKSGFGLTTSNNLSGWWGTSAYSSGPNLPISSTSQLAGQTATIVFTFTSSGARFYFDSSNVTSNFYSATGLKGNIGTTDTINISATAATALVSFISWDKDSYSDTSKATQAFDVASNIPEPSAFGLLAGIGALALAVSRRRRSRK